MRDSFKRLVWPIVILVLCLAPTIFWDDLQKRMGFEVIDKTLEVVRNGIWTAVWLSLAWFVVRLIDVFFWEGVVARRLNGKVPRLLKDVLAGIVFLIAITAIVGVVFERSVTGLWATSGAVGLVVGLALQSMISDVFCGIAINIDRPFKMGDWIRLHQRGIPPMLGCVEEINWRSTRMRTTDNTRIVIPNHLISKIAVTNLCEPALESRFDLVFCLDPDIPVDRVIRVLTAGVRAADGLLQDPLPKVRVNGVGDHGVEYKVRYWLRPADVSPNRARHMVSSSVLQHLHYAGINLAHGAQDIYYAPMTAHELKLDADRCTLLERIDLFSVLEHQEIEGLASRMSARSYQPGDNICEQGVVGESMYVLVEGLLHVFTRTEERYEDVMVGQITPGQFFGEMSLMTGEVRNATVTAATDSIMYKITKEHFVTLLQKRPEIAEVMTDVVVRRRMRTTEALRDYSADEKLTETKNFANQVLEKMRGFFGLGGA